MLLGFVCPVYGDQWEDRYNQALALVDVALNNPRVDPMEAWDMAGLQAAYCYHFIHGFLYGNINNRNREELSSNRYSNWLKERADLREKRKRFVDAENLQNADWLTGLYYFRKEVELNCKYQMVLGREAEAR